MSRREWVLVLGDVAIPELAAELPTQFESLICNLRSSKDKKHVACTGNLGSSGAKLLEFLQSLVDTDANVHLLKGTLPSTSHAKPSDIVEKDSLLFKVGKLSIGMISGYLLRDLTFPNLPHHLRVTCPNTSLLLGADCDLVICNDSSTLSIREGVDGTIYLCPGSVTGVNIYLDSEESMVKVTAAANGPPEASDNPQSPNLKVLSSHEKAQKDPDCRSTPENIDELHGQVTNQQVDLLAESDSDSQGINNQLQSAALRSSAADAGCDIVNDFTPIHDECLGTMASPQQTSLSDQIRTSQQQGDSTVKSEDHNDKENKEGTVRGAQQASFMLLSIEEDTNVTIYTYTLVHDEVTVNQIHLKYPQHK